MPAGAHAGRGRLALGPISVTWRRALPGVAALLWLVAAGWGIGSYPLGEPDEGRNASAALEVATEGRWLLPTYDGLVYVDKPLLWFDTAAVALLVLGKGELAVRLPSLLFTAATLLLVAWFARRLYGVRPAWIAAAAFATSPLVLAYARIVIFDAMLVFFVVLALVLFHEAIEGGGEPAGTGPSADPASRAPSRRPATLAWLAMSLGSLTKGPVAVALPLLVAVPYALWRHRGRALWSGPGVAAFVVLVGGWVAYMAFRVPGYLEYVVLTETWGRLGGADPAAARLGSSGPIRSLFPVLIGGALPWSVVAAWSWIASGRRRPSARGRSGRQTGAPPSTLFLVLWLLLPVLFFTLAEPKRLHYMLPMVPAVALLLAAATARGALTPGALRAGSVSLLPVGGALVLAGTGAWPVLETVHESLETPAHATAVALGALLVLAPAAALVFAGKRPAGAVVALALPGLLLPLVLFPMAAQVSEIRSSKGLAREIDRACPGAPVVGIDVLPASLPFYLGRPVGLNSPTGEPFQSNFVEESWQEIAATRPLFAPGWWRDLPARSVIVFEGKDQVKRLGAEQEGYLPLASNRLFVAFGRGCGAQDTPAPART